MTASGYKTCPVCDGAKTWTVTKYDGLRGTIVTVPCTACDGKGVIPFVDLTKTRQEAVDVKESLEDREISDGWRSRKGWSKIHYFKDGKCLCGGVRSPISISSSTLVEDISSESPCSTCEKKLG